MGSHSPAENKVFILNTEIEQESQQLKYIGEGGAYTFGSWNDGCVKVKENKVLCVVYHNSTGHPNLIGFNKGDTKFTHHCNY